jgi:hypothetical protein
VNRYDTKQQRKADKEIVEQELDSMEEEPWEEIEEEELNGEELYDCCNPECPCCCCQGTCGEDYEDYYMSAWEQLMDVLQDGEEVECVIFGPWGWGTFDEDSQYQKAPDPQVPPSIMGRRLILTEAEPFLKAFSFEGGHGSPDSYATWIYTNQSVFWVTQYDGSTGLSSMPRHPIQGLVPHMPGG